jgi:glycosyltransferase involved in cell wall biosynthesis
MISIVIPFLSNRKSIKMIRKTWRSIVLNTLEPFELIYVKGDDNEWDADVQAMIKAFADKLIISDKQPDSLAGLYNLGFKHAKGEVFINLHSDVEVPRDWTRELSNAAREGLLGCVKTETSNKNGYEEYYIPSCCFSISSRKWEALGGYDEDYKGYHWEDNDLFWRAFDIKCYPVRCDVTVKHIRGASRDLKNDKEYLVRNKKIFDEKHKTRFKGNGAYVLSIPSEANYKGGKDERNTQEDGVHRTGQAGGRNHLSQTA